MTVFHEKLLTAVIPYFILIRLCLWRRYPFHHWPVIEINPILCIDLEATISATPKRLYLFTKKSRGAVAPPLDTRPHWSLAGNAMAVYIRYFINNITGDWLRDAWHQKNWIKCEGFQITVNRGRIFIYLSITIIIIINFIVIIIIISCSSYV